MSQHSFLNPLALSVDEALAPYRKYFRNFTFLVTAILLCVWLGVFLTPERSNSGLADLGALMVIVCGLLPAWIWVSGKMQGLPIIPAIAAYDIVWYASPILAGHPELQNYPEESVFFAGVTVSLYLLGLTAAWLIVGGVTLKPPKHFRGFAQTKKGYARIVDVCFVLLVAAMGWQLAEMALWDEKLWAYIPSAMKTPIRVVLGLGGLLALFVLSFISGRKAMSFGKRLTFIGLTVVYFLAAGATLLLFKLITPMIAIALGFSIGRGRFPWKTMLIIVLIAGFFHVGKGEMREEYWYGVLRRADPVYLTDFPGYYAEWAGHSVNALTGEGPAGRQVNQEETTSIFLRMSLVQMLMMAQDKAPSQVEFLEGKTYVVIPQVLVPRIIWPNKPRALVGQDIINMHFGLQDEDGTIRTAIAWGLAAEAYANFGVPAVFLTGMFFGAFFGLLAHWSRQVPMGSYRFVITLLIFSGAIILSQTALSVWASSLFQGFVVVTGLSIFLMKRFSNERLWRKWQEEQPRSLAARNAPETWGVAEQQTP